VPPKDGLIAVTPAGVWYGSAAGISGEVRAGIGAESVTVHDPGYPYSLASTSSLVYGTGLRWALTGDESIAMIDPATGRVARVYTYRSYDPAYDGGLDFLAVGHGSLWFLDDGALKVGAAPFRGVLRVSAATGLRLGPVPGIGPAACGGPCTQIYATRSAIWVPTATGLIRIDPALVARRTAGN